MATLRLRNPKGTLSLKGFDTETKRKIRQALRSASKQEFAGAVLLDSMESNSKYHNVRTELDGITFDSAREANRYAELKIELLAGEITELELQKPFSLDVSGIHICNYFADFVYKRDAMQIVEDAKGKPTDLYKIKRALMLAIRAIKIVEV